MERRHLLVLQRRLGARGLGRGLGEHRQDLCPEARTAPALVAAVDALPGAEALGERAPGAAGPLDPEHRGHHPPAVAVGASARGPLRRQEREQPLPLAVGQLGAARWPQRDGHGLRAGQGHRPLRPPRHVASLGHRLMAPPPARPGQVEAEPLRRRRQGQQQPAHLRGRQRDQVAGRTKAPLFPPSGSDAAAAWARVTSR
jgi:hypothetical protein